MAGYGLPPCTTARLPSPNVQKADLPRPRGMNAAPYSAVNPNGTTANTSQKPTRRPACLNPAALTQGESRETAAFFQSSCNSTPGSRPDAAPTASSIVTFAPRAPAI